MLMSNIFCGFWPFNCYVSPNVKLPFPLLARLEIEVLIWSEIVEASVSILESLIFWVKWYVILIHIKIRNFQLLELFFIISSTFHTLYYPICLSTAASYTIDFIHILQESACVLSAPLCILDTAISSILSSFSLGNSQIDSLLWI